MLDNEPEGGDRTGSQPTGDAVDSTTADNTTAESTPIRPARTSRRRATAPAAGAAPAEPGSEPSGAQAGLAGGAEPTVTEAAVTEPAPKVRRRRKAAEPGDTTEIGERGQDSVPAVPVETAADAEVAGAAAAAAVPAAEAPAKAVRSRRKKAAPADPVPAAEGGGEPGAAAPTQPPPVGAEPASTTSAGTSADATPATDATDPAEGAPRTRRRRAAPSAPTVLFMAPDPETAAVVGPGRGAAAAQTAATGPAGAVAAEAAGMDASGGETGETSRRRRRGRRTAEEPAETLTGAEVETAAALEESAEEDAEADEEDGNDDDESAAARRRRRRGRRGRGRGKGGADEAEDEAAEPVEAETEPEEDEDDTSLSRRRRRRRRRGAGDADADVADDGVHTVVKIREPRTVDEVQGVSGSTRLEAKRQRRRDGREQRRTRPPILSESEFLARREAVDRVMVVRQRGDRTQIGVLEDNVLVEHYVTRASSGTMAGNVYLGKVQNVLPSMEAAFVDVGRGRNAVLYAGEVNWDATGLEGRARSIEQALRSGDSVLVQVTKDPIGHKGARLTSHIALSGRHLVYVPHGNASGISRKLPENERKRLRDTLKKLVPDGAGVIVRTAAEGASEDELARDIKRLQAQWEEIQAKAAEGGAPVLLYEEPDLVIRVVRDLFNEDFRELVVHGDEAYDMVESYLSHVSPDLVARLHRYTGAGDVFAEKRIDEQILKGLDRKVFLPSGGHLVIDRTEAMTVVDVNTGKYTGAGGNLEETVTRNNLEAAEEIVRQLRLRDLGGILVIDFIDMVLESNRELVLRRLTECLGRDRTKHQVTEITSLGLVQMTRKRIGAGLLEAFSETCECCKGRGVIIHTEPAPEKAKPGAADKVKAVATAPTRTESASSRRRGRKAEPAAPEPSAPSAASVAEDDTMGYDLSRYENDTELAVDPADSTVDPAEPIESMRLAGANDPDAAEEPAAERDGDAQDSGSGARRRSRRTGTRRRTRP